MTQLSITLPDDLTHFLSLQQIVESDSDDTPKAEVLTGIYRALADVKAGRMSPVETLWDDDNKD